MMWVECSDGALFNLEKTSDIRIMVHPQRDTNPEKKEIFEVRAYFPIVLTSEKGSRLDHIIIHSGNLESCKSLLANFRVHLHAKNEILKVYP